MHFPAIAMLLLAVVACGHGRKHDEVAGGGPEFVEPIRQLFAQKTLDFHAATDPVNHWPAPDDCDGLLWAGLALAAGMPVHITLAEDAPGHWQRRPSPCWTPEAGDMGSKSTTSQDMVTGLLWGAWRTKDLALLQRYAAYGEAHEERVAGALVGWVMGEPYPAEASRVLVRQNLYGLVGRLLFALSGGTDDRGYRHEAAAYFAVEKDYERHIQTLGILLQGEARDVALGLGIVSIYEDELERLKEHVAAYPEDALFQAALAVYTGDWGKTAELLQNPAYQYPTYVRGAENYKLVHWLFAAHLLLKHNDDGK